MRLLVVTLCMISFASSQSSRILLDGFEDAKSWQVVGSEGVKINVSNSAGYVSNCLKIEFEFLYGSGYCGIRKDFDLVLPDNYQIRFLIRGEASRNNLEFKLVDSTGENVWWNNRRGFDFLKEWTELRIKKRHISFAWGPTGDREIKLAKSIEIIVSSATGGKGTIYIDELYLEELPPDSILQKIPSNFKVYASSGDPTLAFDLDTSTFWQNDESDKKPNIIVDFGRVCEYGGLKIEWDEKFFASEFMLLSSDDSVSWKQVYHLRSGSKKNYIYLPDGESRFIKIEMLRSACGDAFRLKELRIEDVKFSSTPNIFFKNIASDFPFGFFPKYFYDLQTYWTVVGVPLDSKEALVDENGAIEVNKSGFRLEPFIFCEGKFFKWSDAEKIHYLEERYLPIPTVVWSLPELRLRIKSFSSGRKDSSLLFVEYEIENTSDRVLDLKFYVAVRPFQVLPPWQELNIVGGVAKVKSIRYDGTNSVFVDQKKIYSIDKPDNFGCAEFDQGEIVFYLSSGLLPENKEVTCHLGYASGAFEYRFSIAPKGKHSVKLIIPLNEYSPVDQFNEKFFSQSYEDAVNSWKEILNRVTFILPDTVRKFVELFKSNLAYLLINSDSFAIQPGSRTYERSWIRDGAVSSLALLYCNFTEIVKDYIKWYAGYQYESGKIPCAVDHRGPDPVPEHDSQGEFIFTLYKYFAFTHDTTILKENFSRVLKAVDYIETLRKLRKTAEFRKSDKKSFYGLMTESISHEGYSAKPMHSYWDNFWGLRGIEYARKIALTLGNKRNAMRLENIHNDYSRSLINSIKLAVRKHKIDYIPGCPELGDFDPTSTSIVIYLLNLEDVLPSVLLRNTFKRYKDFFAMRKTKDEWTNYTPYEIRLATSFIYLGDKNFSHQMLKFFTMHLRPYEWNGWAEVVRREVEKPGFVGDIPHSWIGAEYIIWFRSLFVYENEDDSSLVFFAGVPEFWFENGGKIAIGDLLTQFGKVSFNIEKSNDKTYIIKFQGDLQGAKKFYIANFTSRKIKKAFTSRGEIKTRTDEFIILKELPKELILKLN